MSVSFSDTDNPEQIAARIVGMYETWQGYKEDAMSQWEETEAYVYATDTTGLNDAFDHTTHIPIVAEIKEDLEAIMYATILPHEDWLGWRPFDFEAATLDKRDKALAYIKNRNNMNGFRPTLRKLIHDICVYGNAFAMTIYVDERVRNDDGSYGAGYNGPKVVRISPYDIVFDPTATDFDSTPKIVREMLDVEEFLDRSALFGWEEEVVRKVMERRFAETTRNTAQSHKGQQYVPAGFSNLESYYSSNKIEVLWFYGSMFDEESGKVRRKRCIGVVDGRNVLFDIHCPKDRIHKAGWGLRPDNLWSQGPLDRIIGMNYQIDHRENAKSTALDKFIYPDRLLAGDVEEIYDDETGQTRYIAGEGGNVTDVAPDGSVLQFDNQIDRLTLQARSAARLPQQLTGFRTAGEKTLGEVQMLNDGAFRGFIHKAEQFELDMLEPVISDEIEIGVQYFDQLIVAPVEGEDGVQYIDITEDDLRSNGKLIPYGARRFARDLQQLQTIQQLGNSNLVQIIAPHIVSARLAQSIERLGGFEKYEFIEKFGAMQEQQEMQEMANNQEMVAQSKMDNPSFEEAKLQGQLGG